MTWIRDWPRWPDHSVEASPSAVQRPDIPSIDAIDRWSTVIFNNNHKQWGAFSYSQDDDVLRVKVEPRKAAHQELMTIDFPEVSAKEAVLRLRWGKVAVPVTLRAELEREALIRTARQAADIEGGVNHLWEWVAYLVQEDITTPEMPQWTDRIIETFPGYYATQLKAQVLAKMGRTQDAITTAKQALEMGEKELGTNQFLTRDQLDQFSSDVDGWHAGAE